MLAHYFEQEGLATTLISLIRENSEKARPPRALWVPFELGRPLGPPHDAAFQRRVLMAALGLLDAEAGPVHVDFPEETPCRLDNPDWTPPVLDGADLAAEVATLAPLHAAAREARGHTALGLAGLDLDGLGRYLAACLDGGPPADAVAGLRLSEAVRAVMEDLKAAYNEVATAGAAKPSSRQVADWFWGDTAAGRALLALQPRWSAGDDKRLAAVADTFMIPRAQKYRLG